MAAKPFDKSSDSSLSPPPDDYVSATEIATTVQPTVHGQTSKPIAIRSKRRATQEVISQDAPAEVPVSSRLRRAATRKPIIDDETMEGEFDVEVSVREIQKSKTTTDSKTTVKKPTTSKKRKAEDDGDHEEQPKPVVKKRAKTVSTTKSEESIADRTTDSNHLIGAHVSIGGGVHLAIPNTVFIGGNASGFFLKNQRKWETADLDPEHLRLFLQGCIDYGIDAGKCCLPHGSYLVNLAHPDPARKKQAYDSFLNDLTRCHKLGIGLYNFHPGNANSTTREVGIRTIAENLNKAHADPATGNVITVLETMASQGNTIGGMFPDLAEIIALVKDKTRVGVCLDTCHVFAAGYDLRTPEAFKKTMDKFDNEIGLEYLKAFHINDSKAPLNSNRDLHARIGTGYLGLQAFHNLMNDKRFHGLPMILETPINSIDATGKKVEDKGIWAREIKMLESLVGMDVNSPEFRLLNDRLEAEGTAEREKIADQVRRKAAKDAKPKRPTPKVKATPKKKAAPKKKVETESEEDSMEE